MWRQLLNSWIMSYSQNYFSIFIEKNVLSQWNENFKTATNMTKMQLKSPLDFPREGGSFSHFLKENLENMTLTERKSYSMSHKIIICKSSLLCELLGHDRVHVVIQYILFCHNHASCFQKSASSPPPQSGSEMSNIYNENTDFLIANCSRVLWAYFVIVAQLPNIWGE